MAFRTLEEALSVLGEASVDPRTKGEARQFLDGIEPDVEARQLVEGLRHDDFKVRWEAARLLSDMGKLALKEMLNALVDPQKVGDPRLRSGVYHVLHHHKDPAVRQMTANLVHDLNGSAADLKTLHEAHHLLQQIGD
jgi:HEAT repeat protein